MKFTVTGSPDHCADAIVSRASRELGVRDEMGFLPMYDMHEAAETLFKEEYKSTAPSPSAAAQCIFRRIDYSLWEPPSFRPLRGARLS